MEQDDGYSAYLVRLWPTRRRGAADYRVTVESVATGDRHYFPNLESLLNYWRALRGGQNSEDSSINSGSPERNVTSSNSKP